MVEFKLFNCIYRRQKEVKQSPILFDGVSPIAVGDLLQLKPFMDSAIFSLIAYNYMPLALNMWQDLFLNIRIEANNKTNR